jgi:uncharacterized membrane protein
LTALCYPPWMLSPDKFDFHPVAVVVIVLLSSPTFFWSLMRERARGEKEG